MDIDELIDQYLSESIPSSLSIVGEIRRLPFFADRRTGIRQATLSGDPYTLLEVPQRASDTKVGGGYEHGYDRVYISATGDKVLSSLSRDDEGALHSALSGHGFKRSPSKLHGQLTIYTK